MRFIILFLMFRQATARSPSECCNQGFATGSKALTASTSCTPSEADTAGFEGFQKTMCLSFYSSCCETTAKVMFCQMGKQLAIGRQSCSGSSDAFLKTRQTCCHCCKLGQQEALRGGECSSQAGDAHCKEAFADCCSKVTSSAQLTTIMPARKTCKDIKCDSDGMLGCAEETDGPMCQCKPGFRSTKDRLICQDIDECSSGQHTCSSKQACKNTQGDFTCIDNECSTGYLLKDGTCVDDDECLSGKHRCGQYNFCMNSPGSYSCLSRCPTPGYKAVANNVCVDVNECTASQTACPKNFQCINHVGSYSCERVKCDEGYRLVKKQCIDVDECSEEPNICGDGGTCINSYGRYYCNCKTGFQLDSNTKKCVDVNECANNKAYCSYQCENTVGSYKCLCPDGYEAQGTYCYDKDECESNPCSTNEYCFNSFGSYACINQTCPNKYFMQASYNECKKTDCLDDRKCTGIQEQSYKWVTYKFFKTVEPNSFVFNYWTRFPVDYESRFALVSGNEEDLFYIEKVGGSQIRIKNGRQIEGPKRITLILNTDVFLEGNLVYRYVYTFHIFVAAFNFG